MKTYILIFLLFLIPCLGEQKPLIEIKNCQFIPTEWADGDSFQVKLPDGEKHTVRLYGADCVEWHVTDHSDERRLREQRRYFGITHSGGNAYDSIKLAKSFGEAAYEEVQKFSAAGITLYTAFMDGRGDGKYKRIYAFISNPEGKDFASHLVENGLARAYGVSRRAPDGQSMDAYKESLKDLETIAIKKGAGIWAHTDWDSYVKQKKEQREEDAEADFAMEKGDLPEGYKVNVNAAARDEIMRLKGIGEMTAVKIIERRPYKKIEDLLKVPGIGEKTLEDMKEHLSLEDTEGS